jgi:hypothetical protein
LISFRNEQALDDLLFNNWNTMTNTMEYLYFDLYDDDKLLKNEYHHYMYKLSKCKYLCNAKTRLMMFEGFFVEMLERGCDAQEGLDIFINNCIKYNDIDFYKHSNNNITSIINSHNRFLCNIINIFIYYGATPKMDKIFTKIFQDVFNADISYEILSKKFSSIIRLIDILMPYYDEIIKITRSDLLTTLNSKNFNINRLNNIIDLIDKYDKYEINWNNIDVLNDDELSYHYQEIINIADNNVKNERYELFKFILLKSKSNYLQTI